jgi:glycine hydroxymethyltransferase
MKDKQIKTIIDAEIKRQKKVINLIPSENYTSKDVMEAVGSVFDNKYAEGYAYARYYGGNEEVDKLESLCKKRALELFGLKEKDWHVNCQAHSGSPANLAVYLANVPVGTGKIMGMSLTSGGHLTHGQKVSATGKFWTPINFEVDKKTEVIDYEAVKKLAQKEKPNIIVAGFTAYPRVVDFKKFREIADSCGALFMVDMSHLAGLVAGKSYPSPFPYADIVTTTTHKTLRGPRGALIFSRKDERGIDKKIDKAVFPGLQGGPHMSHIAGIAIALYEAKTPAFKTYAKQVIKNAKAFAKEIQKLGWRVVSGGTDSHLLLIDTWANGVTGKIAEAALEKAGIICNKNTIPGETRSPFDPSGIRVGTPAMTTRGYKEKDFVKVAQKIDKVLRGVK